jgi:hypothetical protein
VNERRGSKLLKVAIGAAAAGVAISIALLVRETPYTLVFFMFLAQPLLLAAFVLLGIEIMRDLRARGVL